MFARFRNQYLEHARGVWSSSAHASSRRSAWVKSPRKWRGGRFTTTEKRLELLGKEKKGKREKAGSFIKGVQKAFPVRPYIFTFCRLTKSDTFPFKVAKSMLSGKKFPQDGLFRGENFLQNFLPFSGLFLRGRRSKGVKRGAVKKCPYGVCPYGVCP